MPIWGLVAALAATAASMASSSAAGKKQSAAARALDKKSQLLDGKEIEFTMDANRQNSSNDIYNELYGNGGIASDVSGGFSLGSQLGNMFYNMMADPKDSPDYIGKESSMKVGSLNRYLKQIVNNTNSTTNNTQYAYGDLIPTSGNTIAVGGGKHGSGFDVDINKSNGTKMSVEQGELIQPTDNGLRIFSDRIFDGNSTIATKAKNISVSKGKHETEFSSTIDPIHKNTLNRLIDIDNMKLDSLFGKQETIKDNIGIPNNVPKQFGFGGSMYATGGIEDYLKTDTENANKELMGIFNKFDIEDYLKTDTENANKELMGIFNSVDKPTADYLDTGRRSFGKDKQKTANAVATGMSLLDNLYNGILIGNNDSSDVDFSYVSPESLDYKYDTRLGANNISKSVRNFDNFVQDNMVSSTQRVANISDFKMKGIDKMNELNDTANKFNADMDTKNKLNKQQVNMFNAQTKNQEAMFDYQIASDKIGKRSANFSNAISDIMAGTERYLGIESDRERYNILSKQFADSGVNINTIPNLVDKTSDEEYAQAILATGRNLDSKEVKDAIAARRKFDPNTKVSFSFLSKLKSK